MFEQSLMSKSFEWFKYFNALQCVRGLHVLNVPNSIFNLDVPTSLFHTKRWQLHLNVSHLITKMSNFKLILTVRYKFWYLLSNINFNIHYPTSILIFTIQYQFWYSLSNINFSICCPISISILTIQYQFWYLLPSINFNIHYPISIKIFTSNTNFPKTNANLNFNILILSVLKCPQYNTRFLLNTKIDKKNKQILLISVFKYVQLNIQHSVSKYANDIR